MDTFNTYTSCSVYKCNVNLNSVCIIMYKSSDQVHCMHISCISNSKNLFAFHLLLSFEIFLFCYILEGVLSSSNILSPFIAMTTYNVLIIVYSPFIFTANSLPSSNRAFVFFFKLEKRNKVRGRFYR